MSEWQEMWVLAAGISAKVGVCGEGIGVDSSLARVKSADKLRGWYWRIRRMLARANPPKGTRSVGGA